eukprot:m.22685 g.22685  ORF g.22685 m.22685 type:complete len:336 (-) comp9359_c0_seq2:103-1110(-)
MSLSASIKGSLAMPADLHTSRIPTGYASNNRPVIGYSSEVDDDPGMKSLCQPNLHFSTRTVRDFDPSKVTELDATERSMHPKAWGTEGSKFAANTQGYVRASPTRSSGFTNQFSHTLPKSKEVEASKDFTTETKSTFRQLDLYPTHKTPAADRRGGIIHPSRSSAFTNNLQTNASTKDLDAEASFSTIQSEAKSKYVLSPSSELRLPPIVKQPTQFEWGYRSRPAFLPPSSRLVYGEAVKVDSPSTQRLAKQDPAEYFNRKEPRSTATWTQTNYGDKHSEAMAEGRRFLESTKHLLQDTTKKQSGFVRNVDIFSVEPDDTTERFQTMTRTSFRLH